MSNMTRNRMFWKKHLLLNAMYAISICTLQTQKGNTKNATKWNAPSVHSIIIVWITKIKHQSKWSSTCGNTKRKKNKKLCAQTLSKTILL